MAKQKPRGVPSKSDRPKRAKRRRTVTSGVTGGAAPARVPQAHGGELLAGGLPGHKGAGGRPRNEIRELALRGYEEALPILIEMATGRYRCTAYTDKGEEYQRACTPREMKDAATELGNRGVGKMVEIDVPRTPVQFGVLVSPEVAAQRARDEAAERQAAEGGET